MSRYAFGSKLSEKQSIQNYVADSAADIHALRLMVLHAAWQMDHVGQKEARHSVAMVKYVGAQVLYNVIDRALQVHGSLGYSTDMPLELMYRQARAASIVDGPDEVHRVSVARRILRNYEPKDIPTEHVPTRRAEAQAKFASILENVTANL